MARKKTTEERVRNIRKKIRRESELPYGKAGIHADKRERRRKRMSTDDYLEEAEAECEPEDGSVDQDLEKNDEQGKGA